MDSCSSSISLLISINYPQKESQTSDLSEKILEKLERLDLNRSLEMLDMKKKLDIFVKTHGQFEDTDFDSDRIR